MMLVREKRRIKLLSLAPTHADNDDTKQLCKLLPDIPKEAIGRLLSLSKLAYQSYFERSSNGWRKASNLRIIFSEEDLTQCNIKITDNFDGEGLLKVESLHQLSGDCATYNFTHLSVQEFLCAIYMLTLSQEEQYHLLKEYFNDYPNIMILYCGLTTLDFHQVVYSKLTSSYSTVTAVKCLYEGQRNTAPHQLISSLVLNMSHITLLPYDVLCLSYMCCHHPVTQLNMSGCHIGDKAAGILAKWCLNKNKTTKLQELNLTSNNLTSEGMKHVMKIVTSEPHYLLLPIMIMVIIIGSPSLQVLDVSLNDIKTDGISLCLQHINTLTKLMVAGCGLSVEGTVYCIISYNTS